MAKPFDPNHLSSRKLKKAYIRIVKRAWAWYEEERVSKNPLASDEANEFEFVKADLKKAATELKRRGFVL